MKENNEDVEIAGIVVSYNKGKEELLNNIKTYIDFIDILIIVDNSDKENDLKDIKDKKIKYISMNGNQGIAKALNQGIEYAINKKYKYALTMDQDSKFSNNLIDEYKKYLSNDVIIYSPNYIIERKKTKKYKENTKELYWTMTSGNLLNLELYKIVGKFKEDFFIDVVDYEYCLRARQKNYKILQCNKAELVHNPGIQREMNFIFFKYKYGYMSPERLYYQIRNLYWIRKNYKCARAILLIIMKWIKVVLLFDNKKTFLKMFYKGRKDCLNGNFGKLSNYK